MNLWNNYWSLSFVSLFRTSLKCPPLLPPPFPPPRPGTNWRGSWTRTWGSGWQTDGLLWVSSSAQTGTVTWSLAQLKSSSNPQVGTKVLPPKTTFMMLLFFSPLWCFFKLIVMYGSNKHDLLTQYKPEWALAHVSNIHFCLYRFICRFYTFALKIYLSE